MPSGFRETFTKDESKDDLLNYDDSAFYYFACSVLLVVAVPWTLNFLYNLIFPGRAAIARDYPKKNKNGNIYKYCKTAAMVEQVVRGRKEAKGINFGSTGMRAVIIVCLWVLLVLMGSQLGQESQIKSFDPFDILGVSPGADDKEIKQAYRKLSLIYHPDKNPDDPLASSKFIQITQAHKALTDETAKTNYEKYGNPDGPQTTKVGIGLPRFLLEKSNHIRILCAFFAFLLFVVPMTFICYYQRTKNYAANGVMIETLQFLGYYMNEATRVKNCPELLAASAESRFMLLRASDNTSMPPIMSAIVEHKKRQFSMPIIVRNQTLIWAHMQRQHHLLTPELQQDLNELLQYSMKITQAMVEIACMREWFFTAQAMIEFRRCLVQGLDVKSSALLQIPHFTEDTLKHAFKGKNSTTSLIEFVTKEPDQRKGTAEMNPQQLQDIEAFCHHMSEVELKAVVQVEDEDAIVVGDVATVIVQISRKNLKEGEALGPVHAPLFPVPKFEEWWIFLVESASTKIIAFERIRDTDNLVQEKLRFQVGRPGKHQFVLHALCDSYAGLDTKIELSFNALTEEEVKREIFVHKEDEDLDLQPTLFQQFMGEFNQDEESEEEEEDVKSKQKIKAQAQDLSEEKKKDDDDDSDDKDDDSSSSSSDSEAD